MAVVRAFVVEDNRTIRENLIGTLREVARVQTVGEAASEAAGQAWLAAHPEAWELAIIDIFLLGGSGLRLLQACRRRQPWQKVVVLSGHATHDMRWKCRMLGADAVFDKATEVDDLIDFCLRQREAGARMH